MKKGNLANIMNGELCTQKIGGEENTFNLIDSEESVKAAEERYGFQTTYDSDGGEHFGIWLSEEELNHRLEMIRQFYKEGMIPWICPSCGKMWGGLYDVGSIVSFQCHVCGAKWEQTNPEEVDRIIEDAKKPKLEVLCGKDVGQE